MLRRVMVPLARLMVSAGGARGGSAGGDGIADDVTGECAAGDPDGVAAVVLVMWMRIHPGWWW